MTAAHQPSHTHPPLQVVEQQRQRAVGQELGAAGAAQRGAAAAGGVAQRVGTRGQQQARNARYGRGGRAARAVAG